MWAGGYVTVILMKSRDILSPDIGPGIRTQDSVVTSGTTISYATEAVSNLDHNRSCPWV